MDESLKQEVYRLHALICKTLSDPKRLMILDELRSGPKSVGELSKTLELRQANVSQHLAVMRERNIVTYRREGATVYYSLSSPKIAEACDKLHEVLEEQLARSQALAADVHAFQPNPVKRNVKKETPSMAS